MGKYIPLFEEFCKLETPSFEESANKNETDVYNGRELGNYEFSFKCTDVDDAEELQDITHYDEMCNNDYCIDDDYFGEEIVIISLEDFLSHVYGKVPKEKNIEFCAWNQSLDVVFCYDKKGIHWIYE